MKKKLYLGIVGFVVGLAVSFPALAAPKTMADGGFFDAAYYAAANPDVVRIYGTDENSLYQHYLQYGRFEGRQTVTGFDPAYYANKYPDVVGLLGDNPTVLYNHYLTYGIKENRFPTAVEEQEKARGREKATPASSATKNQSQTQSQPQTQASASTRTQSKTTNQTNTQSQTSTQQQTETKETTQQSGMRTYVLNTNTKNFHYMYCRYVDDIYPENYDEYYGTREEVLTKGYTPCQVCNP